MKQKAIVSSVGFLLMLSLITGVVCFGRSAAAAITKNSLCGGINIDGRPGCVGYFFGQNMYGPNGMAGYNIIDCETDNTCSGPESQQNAIPEADVYDAASFESFLVNDLNRGGGSYEYNAAGAAFIIDSMLGVPGTNFNNSVEGINYAKAHLAQWETDVNDYQAAGRITWKDDGVTLGPGNVNSMHACTTSSAAYCTQQNIGNNDSRDFTFFKMPAGDYEVSNLIVFHNPNGSDFTIRRECGNLVGNVQALQTNQPPVGTITEVDCTVVSVKLWDPDDPTDSINYYLSVNGAAKQGPKLFRNGKNGNPQSIDVSGMPGFDYWRANSVALYGEDNQTHTQYNLGSVSLPICGRVSCGSSTLPAALTAGQPITFKVWMKVTGAPDGPPGARFTSIKLSSLSTTSPYAYSASDLYSNGINFTPPTAGTYTLTWTFGGGESDPTSVTCSTRNVSVTYMPYFSVLGGDASAGQGYETVAGGGCTGDNRADIEGYNLGVSNQYFGAGSRQAAIATGAIDQFATDMTNDYTTDLGGSTDGISRLPSALAIANNGMPTGNTYGGNFINTSSQQWCVPNYVSSVAGPTDYTAQPDWNAITAKPNGGGYIVRLSGDQPIGNITLQPGVRVTVVVTGNVYIDGNVTYRPYATLQDIPQFNLLVSGSIFIDPSVSSLHGFYDAQPVGGSGGQLSTCADGYTSGSELKSYDSCSQQPLTVYGAVSAAKIIPGRTVGNLVNTSTISNDPAEQFVYTPELWLGGVSGPTVSCATDPSQDSCAYQSYTSLPPVL